MSDVSATLVDLEQRLARAWVGRDRDFIEALLAPEWTVIDPSGRLLTRRDVLEDSFGSADRRIDTMAVDDLRVLLLTPTSAVVTGRTLAAGSYRGAAASVALRFTDVFLLREKRWQVIASQGTFIS
jgi:hypothetical protein